MNRQGILSFWGTLWQKAVRIPSESHAHHLPDVTPRKTDWQAGRQASLSYWHWIKSLHRPRAVKALRRLQLFSTLLLSLKHKSQVKSLSKRPTFPFVYSAILLELLNLRTTWQKAGAWASWARPSGMLWEGQFPAASQSLMLRHLRKQGALEARGCPLCDSNYNTV